MVYIKKKKKNSGKKAIVLRSPRGNKTRLVVDLVVLYKSVLYKSVLYKNALYKSVVVLAGVSYTFSQPVLTV